MRFHFAEKIMLAAIVALALLDLTLIAARGQQVDWAGYAGGVATVALLLGIGQFYRRTGRGETIALAVTGAGLYIAFTIVGSIFNYLLLPISREPIDAVLARADAAFGFHWPDFVSWFGDRPGLVTALGLVYTSSLLQLVAITIVLGFAGNRATLEAFLLTGMIGAMIAMGVWFVFPSFGTSTIYLVDQGGPMTVDMAVHTVVGAAYANELMQVAFHGKDFISPHDTLGLIAFPSFHTVMALMAVWFARSSRWLLAPLAIVNVLMIPAILLHGGHHLVDVLGGFAVFAVSAWLASLVLAREPVPEPELIPAE